MIADALLLAVLLLAVPAGLWHVAGYPHWRAVAVAAVLLASNVATWWITASHFEALALTHGWAYRVRFADGGSQLKWKTNPTKGTWIE